MSNTKLIYIRKKEKETILKFIEKINDQNGSDVSFSKYLRLAGLAIAKMADPNDNSYPHNQEFINDLIERLTEDLLDRHS